MCWHSEDGGTTAVCGGLGVQALQSKFEMSDRWLRDNWRSLNFFRGLQFLFFAADFPHRFPRVSTKRPKLFHKLL
ncbi:MAG: hypothetical protein KME06_15590 [Kastovskya adunca ATA6-11-RM4]|nr:hypothetical protein [Kastovskya adunca ATA6-11-RM4]